MAPTGTDFRPRCGGETPRPEARDDRHKSQAHRRRIHQGKPSLLEEASSTPGGGGLVCIPVRAAPGCTIDGDQVAVAAAVLTGIGVSMTVMNRVVPARWVESLRPDALRPLTASVRAGENVITPDAGGSEGCILLWADAKALHGLGDCERSSPEAIAFAGGIVAALGANIRDVARPCRPWKAGRAFTESSHWFVEDGPGIDEIEGFIGAVIRESGAMLLTCHLRQEAGCLRASLSLDGRIIDTRLFDPARLVVPIGVIENIFEEQTQVEDPFSGGEASPPPSAPSGAHMACKPTLRIVASTSAPREIPVVEGIVAVGPWLGDLLPGWSPMGAR